MNIKPLIEIYGKTATSDAGFGDKGTIHSYIDGYYEPMFEPYRNIPIKLLEIGINEGHSMLMWAEYFANVKLTGVDIVDRGFRLSGHDVVYGDATDPSLFDGMDDFDIIIDDGSHSIVDQLKTFEILFPKLKPNGLYVIEDVQNIDYDAEALKKLHPSFTLFDFRWRKQRYDDVIVQYKKDFIVPYKKV